MTEDPLERFKPLIAKIQSIVGHWEPLLDLPGVEVDHRWHDGFMDELEDLRTGAQTITRWEYRMATIHWYLPSLARLSDEDLVLTVVHEFCHVLLAPMDAHMKANTGEYGEFATESVARALIRTEGKDT